MTILIRAHTIYAQEHLSSSRNKSAHFTNDENVWGTEQTSSVGWSKIVLIDVRQVRMGLIFTPEE